MSVWKAIKSDVLGKDVKKQMLERSLEEIGIGINWNVKEINNKFGTDTVDGCLINLKTNKNVSLGLSFTEKKGIILKGDIWQTGLGFDGGQQKLLNKIAQTYQKNNVEKILKGKGAIIKNKTVEADGSILIKAIQY